MTPPRNVFVSYASGGFLSTRNALCQSALNVGFDDARPRGFDNLDQKFIADHHEILSAARGAGYWLWKPQIILQELKSLKRGDLLVYSDAGRSDYYLLHRFPKRLANLARANGFLLGPTIGHHGPMAHWTKRDAFVLLNMDTSATHGLAPIQATWSFWTPVPAAFAFLEAWLAACTDARILTDIENSQGQPNLPNFRDHRHDQAVLSLLAYKTGAPYLNFSGTFLERLLLLRPQSRLANLFLKRIEDAESILQKRMMPALFRSLRDIS